MKQRMAFLLLLTVTSMVLSGCMLPIFGNEPPVIDSSPKLTATVGVLYTYQMDVYDDDRSKLVFNLNLAPDGMTINLSLIHI